MRLNPQWRIGDLPLTQAPFLVPFGSDYGTPDSSPEVLTSFLTDGDLEMTARRGNRTLTLPVLIEWSDMAEAARAEASLIAECEKDLNTLYVDPGDGVGEPFQFTVFRGVVTFTRNDDYEQMGYRLFEVVWRALPWPESTEEITVPALAASGSTTTSVDAMGSATGWTGAVDGAAVTPVSSGGALSVTSPSPLTGNHALTLTRTGTIDTSVTPYLFVDWKCPDATGVSVSATGDGVSLPIVATQASPTAGYKRTWFQAAAASVTVLAINVPTQNLGGPSGVGRSLVLTLDQLSKTDARPTLGSVKQQLRKFDVKGSAPTVGSLGVEHSTTSLGDVLIYTYPDAGLGYVPCCRNYRSSGNTPVSDAAAISGFYDLISSGGVTTYQVPASALTKGDHLVMLRARNATGSASVTITATATPKQSGTAVGATLSLALTTTLTTSFTFLRFGWWFLPSVRLSPSAVMEFAVSSTNPGGGNATHLDELLLFNMVTGRLSQFALGTGTAAAGGPSNRVWIDSPTPANDGLGDLLRGFAADRSDAFSAWGDAVSPTVHEFLPGPLNVYIAATNPTTAVDASYRYRPAGHSSVYSGS